MLLGIKALTMAMGLMMSAFPGESAEASNYAKPISSEGVLTNYSLEEPGIPVLARWKAENGSPRAIILAIHGFGLHKYTYAPFAERMSALGVSTYALDVRGFGEWIHSQPANRRLNIERALVDIRATLKEVREQNPQTPIFLLGESMGGALALRAAADNPELVKGVISAVPSGKLYGKKALAVELAVRFLLSGGSRIDIGKQILGRATSQSALAKEWLSDAHVRLRVNRSELMQFNRFMSHNDKVAKSLANTSVLMVQGKQDKLVMPVGTVKLFNELPTRDKSMILVRGGEHLLFEEGQFDESLVDSVVGWINAHT